MLCTPAPVQTEGQFRCCSRSVSHTCLPGVLRKYRSRYTCISSLQRAIPIFALLLRVPSSAAFFSVQSPMRPNDKPSRVCLFCLSRPSFPNLPSRRHRSITHYLRSDHASVRKPSFLRWRASPAEMILTLYVAMTTQSDIVLLIRCHCILLPWLRSALRSGVHVA